LVAVVAAIAYSAALAVLVAPPAVAALFVLLAGLAAASALTRTLGLALLTLIGAAVAVDSAQYLIATGVTDPAFASFGGRSFFGAPVVAGLPGWLPALLLTLALAVAWLVGRRARTELGLHGAHSTPNGRPWPEWPAWPVVQGLEQVEREVARAAQYNRPLSLGLLGIVGADGNGAAGDERMDRLADFMRRDLTRFDILVRYSPSQLLLVLPELSAQAVRSGAGALAEQASRFLRAPVQTAFVTFPQDGGTVRQLMSALQRRRTRVG
jgi:hypothetical protein